MGNVKFFHTSTGGATGKDGLSAYEIAVKNGFAGTETEWLESITTIVEGENIINRSVIGTAGVIKERAVTQTSRHEKYNLFPLSGDINIVNSDGVWVCPMTGIYTISVESFYVTGGAIFRYIGRNAPDPFDESCAIAQCYGQHGGAISAMTVTTNLNAGDIIGYYEYNTAYVTRPEVKFTITLNTSINLSTWDLYEQWKKQDSAREGITFDDWIKIIFNVETLSASALFEQIQQLQAKQTLIEASQAALRQSAITKENLTETIFQILPEEALNAYSLQTEKESRKADEY